jgi:hypothetical protein
MVGSNYLDGQEGLYGLTTPVPAGLGEQASAIVDNYLKRTEGLLYQVDKNGNPAYMKGMTPSMQLTIADGITAGTDVVVTITPAVARQDMVGEILVLDRTSPDTMEAVVVSAYGGTNQLTLANVQFNHVANVKADIGLVITEERSCPAKRSVVRYGKYPCVRILSLMGRYGYGRRSSQFFGGPEDNLFASVQQFGGPPAWTSISLPNVSWSDATGEIWIPASNLMTYYSDVRIKYVAGFVEVPDAIVRATAAIAQSLLSSTQLVGGGFKTIQAGDTRIERFGSTNVDDDTRGLLNDFKARIFY